MASIAKNCITPVHIDGTTLEGGGQLLRLSLALSSLTGTPFHITDIRGKRGPLSTPGSIGGMKQAHLAGAQWLEAVTSAESEGMELKSRELVFRPSGSTGRQASSTLSTTSRRASQAQHGVWKYIYEGDKLVRRDSYITMTSPGSIFLVLQAVLPYILFSPASSQSHKAISVPVPVRLTITGGTNVWHSLSYEYADQVLFPMLQHKLGFEKIRMKLVRRGWSTGSNGIGEVIFHIVPLASGTQLVPFSFEAPGELKSITVSVIAPISLRRDIKTEVIKLLVRHFPDATIEWSVDEDSKHEKRLYLLLVAESKRGFRLGRDWLYDERINRDHPLKTVSRLVNRVVNDLRDELVKGGCVDEFLQDQLVVFQTLCRGKSVVRRSDPSLHTKTAIWLAGHMANVVFDVDGSCEGLGYVAGRSSTDGADEEVQEASSGLEALKVSEVKSN